MYQIFSFILLRKDVFMNGFKVFRWTGYFGLACGILFLPHMEVQR